MSGVFKVQLGQVTEYFNIIWNAAEYDWEVYFPKEDMCHPDFPHIRCLADAIGRDSISEFVIDGKHTMQKAPWWDEQKIVETYYWQAQHNMLVWGMGRFALTPIWGNDKGDPLWIDGNPDHQEAYLEKVNAFWWHVEHKTPPNQQDPGEEIVIALDDMRTLSMDGNNSWAELADRYREQEANAKLFESAKKEIKELVPADVKNAYGYGVQIKRNKKGSLTVTTYEGNDAA